MNNKSKIRPPFLSALCILSFAGGTAGFIGYFLASLFFEKSSELIIQYSSWHSTDAISPLYFTILMFLFAISLTGAIRIWKFRKDGFYIYSISQLAILFLPVIWIDWNSFSVSNAIFTGVFIAGYLLNFKYLKLNNAGEIHL
jgi:hypothetical protein